VSGASSVLAAAVLLLLPAASEAGLARLAFSAEAWLEPDAVSQVSLGSATGVATRLPDDTLVFPPADWSGAGPLSFAPSRAACISPLTVFASGFGGGTLVPGEAIFRGPIRIDGELLVRLMEGWLPGVGELALPLALGSRASPTAVAFASPAPAATRPPAQARLSLSFSRWKVTRTYATGTRGGVQTQRAPRTGYLVTLTDGVQLITLVTPIHVHYEGLDPMGAARFGTVPFGARMQIRVAQPPLLLGQLGAAITLAGLGLARRRKQAASRRDRARRGLRGRAYGCSLAARSFRQAAKRSMSP